MTYLQRGGIDPVEVQGYHFSKMKSIKTVSVLLFLSLLFVSHQALAQISIDKRTGNLSITTAEGNLFTVAPSDSLPQLASGSVIEVLSGDAEVKLAGPDILTVVAGESVMNLIGGDQVAVNVDNNGADAQIQVQSGNLQVSIGEVILSLKAAASIKANISEGKASVVLLSGEAAIVEFAGNLKPLTQGQSYDLGSIAPTFSEEMQAEMEEPEAEPQVDPAKSAPQTS